jgi:hypothetical protein
MKKIVYLFSSAVFAITMYSCKKYLQPNPENNTYSKEYLMKKPDAAYGLLMNAYIALPGDELLNDVATDNATTPKNDLAYWRMANGEWKATYNPLNVWDRSYQMLRYIHLFKSIYKDILWEWKTSANNPLFIQRFTGELHGLRAYYYLSLLQAHSGLSTENILLGVPLVLQEYTEADNMKLPRNTFDKCITQIVNDCDTAIKYLPVKYANGSANDLVFGGAFDGLVDKRVAMVIKSRATLLAASPAFTVGKTDTEKNQLWVRSATASSDLLKILGNGTAANGFSTTRVNFYLFAGKDDKEIIWRKRELLSNVIEIANYPPSLNGKGSETAGVSPSQNIVDAFPMKTGYPYANETERKDYINKDLRFKNFIVYDGSTVKGSPIYTGIEADLPNGINKQNSTRTGYFLRKFIDEGVNLSSTYTTTTNHFVTLARATEIFMIYAEAANQAWGPNGDPLNIGLTPKTILGLIRKRAGIDSKVATPTVYDDDYLNEQAALGTEALNKLIKNERRVELCFEQNFRFWDLRRWKDEISVPVNGVLISTINSVKQYEYKKIEDRVYKDYMYYGPIPYAGIFNYVQNKGW